MTQDSHEMKKWEDEARISRLDSFDDPFGRRLSLYENNRTFSRTPDNRARTTTPKYTTSEIRKASFECPLSYSSEDGLKMVKGGRFSVLNTFCLNERWNASFHGSSVIRGSTGYTSAQGDMSYRIGSLGNIRGGLIVGEHKEVVIGGQTRYGKSQLSATISTRASQLSKWRSSLSASHVFGKGTVRTNVSLQPSRPTNYLVSFASRTMHKWQVGLGWSLQRPLLSLSLTPKLSARRLLHLSATWRGKAMWHFGVDLTQTLESAARVGIGVWCYSSKGMCWVISWTDTELSLRIPITIGSTANPWFTSLQMLFVSILTHAISDMVGRLVSLEQGGGEATKTKESSLQTKRKTAQQGAIQQQALMKRQAESRRAQEEEKNGLIIQKAVYHIQGGDEFDVTVPLQFWVSDSFLELPESSKKNMFGFYDISIEQKVERESDVTSNWLAGFWESPKQAEGSSASRISPRLTIRYKFNGVAYKITIQDLESLTLPSQRASQVLTSDVV